MPRRPSPDSWKDARYKQAAQDLIFWSEGQDFFTCHLYNLITKADPKNRWKIAKGFPVEVAVFEEAEKDFKKFREKYKV